MVPEDLSEGAALSAPVSTGEEPTSTPAEAAEGAKTEAVAPLASWADLSEEAPVRTTAEPEDLADLGIEPATG